MDDPKKWTHIVFVHVTNGLNRKFLGEVFPCTYNLDTNRMLVDVGRVEPGFSFKLPPNQFYKLRPVTYKQFMDSKFRKAMKAFYGAKEQP
ncbi:MAG TPA: hypothetical protein VGD26_04050 [Chitinophagaceae bacterium]